MKTEIEVSGMDEGKLMEKEPYEAKGPTVFSCKLSVDGSKYIWTHSFRDGSRVPVYEVETVHALNQLIGHAKFNNRTYGNVFYRGECKLHASLNPVLYRQRTKIDNMNKKLLYLIRKIAEDPRMKSELKIDNPEMQTEVYKIEGMLQHYGIPTRFIDLVDNHWIALWMGLNKAIKSKRINLYYHYTERTAPLVEMAEGKAIPTDDLFQYVLLMAIPFAKEQISSGIQISKDYIVVDLRQALPSTFLRPHAQHGTVARKKVHSSENKMGTAAYDMAPSVVGIIRIRIDRVHEWMGKGDLLTQNNLFPPPAYDYGYDVLLKRSDLFDGTGFSVAQYV